MRVRVEIGINSIDVFYRHTIMAFIKEALSIEDKDYKEDLYSTDDPKPFTFSVYMPKFTIRDKESVRISSKYTVLDKVFILPMGLNLNLSTFDSVFFSKFIKGVEKVKESGGVEINGKLFKIGSCTIVNEKSIKSEYTFFKTLSPLLMNKKSDARLKEIVNEIMDKKLKSLRGYGLKKELVFIPLKMREKKVKHTLKGIRDEHSEPYVKLDALEGRFVLKGDAEDLRIIYQAGFLNRTSQGFGMLEVC